MQAVQHVFGGDGLVPCAAMSELARHHMLDPDVILGLTTDWGARPAAVAVHNNLVVTHGFGSHVAMTTGNAERPSALRRRVESRPHHLLPGAQRAPNVP